MKKFAIALAALAVMAAAASAAVYSQNAVGFINVTLNPGELATLTIPFVNMNADDGAWLFDDTQIAADAPVASTVYFWENGGWTPFSKKKGGFSTKHYLKPGEAFFFKLPDTAQATTLTINGEVPDDEKINVAILGAENLSSVGNPYPVPFEFDSSSLAAQATVASTVYFWENGGWTPFSKKKGGFSTKRTVEPGHGVFFKTVKADGSYEWIVEKEYEFP